MQLLELTFRVPVMKLHAAVLHIPHVHDKNLRKLQEQYTYVL